MKVNWSLALKEKHRLRGLTLGTPKDIGHEEGE
jgi:hypothetical protein